MGAGRYAQRFPGEVCDVKNGGRGTAAEAAASSHESGRGQREASGPSQEPDGPLARRNAPKEEHTQTCAPAGSGEDKRGPMRSDTGRKPGDAREKQISAFKILL